MNGKIRYAKFDAYITSDERRRILAHPIFQIGDTVAVWVNESDLCMLGECLDPKSVDLRSAVIDLLTVVEATDDHTKWFPALAKLNEAVKQ